MVSYFYDMIAAVIIGALIGYFAGSLMNFPILGLIIGFFLGIISGIVNVHRSANKMRK